VISEPDAVEVFHDGVALPARAGESLALSLIAADRVLLSRSPKLHRPRGPYCLRGACEGCLVRVNGLPNQAACRVMVQGGEQVETQNVLGSRDTDVLAAADFLFPQGIDHHRLLAGIPGISNIVANFARRIAGLGRLADSAPAASPAESLDLDVLVVGGGERGLSAARALGRLATVVDDGHAFGGALAALDPPRAQQLASDAERAGARLLAGSVLSLSREPDDGSGRLVALIVCARQTFVVRCRFVLLATGRHDASPAFPNNDLPGIFSARAALMAWRSQVLVGSRIALVGSGRFADALVEELSGTVELVQLEPHSIVRAIGRDRIRAVEVQTGAGQRRIKVDALAFDGAGAPSFELAVQAGGNVDFDPAAGYFPRLDGDGKVAERVYQAGTALTLEVVQTLLR